MIEREYLERGEEMLILVLLISHVERTWHRDTPIVGTTTCIYVLLN